jgi:ABC-type oligopeptide transport system ATPase subunit
VSKSKADDLVDETLAMVGIAPWMADRKPTDVSGGQRQRMAIARSLVVNPALILCDEVVSALDVSVQGTVLNFLKKYCDENNAGLIFVSHGLPATAFVSREMMVMRNGIVVEQGSVDAVVNHSTHPYTQTLIEAYKGLSRPLISTPTMREPLLSKAV